ncbi:MAG: hypothetical protein GX100_02840, partial [candidate division WS1 bacterium]|nr:hypothetical protein [candidate division WS1 bacterium]
MTDNEHVDFLSVRRTCPLARGMALAAVLLIVVASLAQAHTCGLMAQVDLKRPLSVEQCRQLGITSLWFYNYCRFNPTKRPDGTTTYLDEATRKQIETLGNLFEGSGIAVFPVLSFWYGAPAEAGQTSRWDAKPTRYRCFSANTENLEHGLRELVQVMSAYRCMSGICLADEPGVPLGGCVCPWCREAYLQTTGLEPPALEDYALPPKGLAGPDHPVLRWTSFQNEQMRRFFTSLAAVIREANPSLEVSLIPAAPFYAGKHLTLPGASYEEMLATGRRIGLDPAFARHFQGYLQWRLNRVDENGWEEELADGLLLSMAPEGQVPGHYSLPLYDSLPGERLISAAALRLSVLQTCAEGARAVCYFPGTSLPNQHFETAAQIWTDYILPLAKKAPELQPVPGRVAVFYSTTTRAFAELWPNNPLERYRQLHACEALSYYFLKRGIPCDTLIEDEIPNVEALRRYQVIVAPGIEVLSPEALRILQAYLRGGGCVLVDPTSRVRIPGAQKAPFDAFAWYRAVENGTQHLSDMEYQAGLLHAVLGERVSDDLAPCRCAARELTVNYLSNGHNLYAALVNFSLHTTVSSRISFDRTYRTWNVLEDRYLGTGNELTVKVEPA